jgi:hypothetical protein
MKWKDTFHYSHLSSCLLEIISVTLRMREHTLAFTKSKYTINTERMLQDSYAIRTFPTLFMSLFSFFEERDISRFEPHVKLVRYRTHANETKPIKQCRSQTRSLIEIRSVIIKVSYNTRETNGGNLLY